LLFLISLAHQSMSSAPAAMYQQPYGGMIAYQPARAYAPAYCGGGRVSYRRPMRLRQPQFHFEQPQAYFRPSGRPLYDPAAISPYAYYGQAQEVQAPQILVLTPEQAQQALFHPQQPQHQKQIYFFIQPQQALVQPQAYVHQPQQTQASYCIVVSHHYALKFLAFLWKSRKRLDRKMVRV
jgi:hypothetical protein